MFCASTMRKLRRPNGTSVAMPAKPPGGRDAQECASVRVAARAFNDVALSDVVEIDPDRHLDAKNDSE